MEGVWVKRDDLFVVAGVNGGKARGCWVLSDGASGLVTASNRVSPQGPIIAAVAKQRGIPCRVHTPRGGMTKELEFASNLGAELVRHKCGYNSVIIARAREDAKKLGWKEIPFGMSCRECVDLIRNQVDNVPPGVKRIVMVCGSGISLAGVLWGLRDARRDIPILGVRVGADPVKRLDIYAPPLWRMQVSLVNSGYGYHKVPDTLHFGDILLDPIYEAKCLPFLRPGDLFWIVGVRPTI